jgi:hypothetical protein
MLQTQTRQTSDRHNYSNVIIHLPVYAIYTLRAIATWIAVTLIDVDLTVWACGAWLAAALIAIDQVLTVPSKLAGVALTLIDLCLAEVPSETRVTVASEWILPINTLPTVTRRALAVIYVCFTISTWQTQESISATSAFITTHLHPIHIQHLRYTLHQTVSISIVSNMDISICEQWCTTEKEPGNCISVLLLV